MAHDRKSSGRGVAEMGERSPEVIERLHVGPQGHMAQAEHSLENEHIESAAYPQNMSVLGFK